MDQERGVVHSPLDAELVLEPAAHAFLPSVRGELYSVVVDFLLRRALDHKRDGLIESKVVLGRLPYPPLSALIS